MIIRQIVSDIAQSLHKQLADFGFLHTGKEVLARLNQTVNEFFLLLLQLIDFLLDGPFGDEFINLDGILLADAVGSVGGLLFYSGIPPGIIVNDHISASEIETSTASFEGDKEDICCAAVEGID